MSVTCRQQLSLQAHSSRLRAQRLKISKKARVYDDIDCSRSDI